MQTDDQSRSLVRSALDHARLVSEELANAARRARYSSRSRKAFTKGGFQGRRHATLFRYLVWASFALMVALPSLGGLIYYGSIASDQYVAETQFTIMGGELPQPDGLENLTGLPPAAIVQDTQIVVSFLQSRAAVEKLNEIAQLRERYTRPDIDPISRFPTTSSIEKFVKYWRRMTDVSIKMPGGIVELQIRAFSPEDALTLAQASIAASESLINDINARMLSDAVRNSNIELARSAERLTESRLNLEKARNEEGMLDAKGAGDALNKLIDGVRTSLISLRQEYNSHLSQVSESAPQMRLLKARIDSMNNEIAELEAKVTSVKQAAQGDRTVSGSISKFAELDLEHQIAERLYAGAAASLEIAKIGAERKLMYVNTFVVPVLPQEAQYPRRVLYPALFFLACLSAWGALVGLGILARDNMA